MRIKKIIFLIFLIAFSSSLYSSHVDTLSVYSESMKKYIKNIVIIPDTHEFSDNIPVIYLLHGAYGDYTDWISKTKGLEEFCDDNAVIIVCPDGGYNSWYFDSPIDKNFMYETYILKELIPYIDASYSTNNSKEFRAITGLSMGGHGAFYLAIRHPELFGAAGSMSGALDIRPFSKEWNISDRIGKFKDFPANWHDNTITNMIDDIKESKLKLIFDCGKDDFFFDVNNIFHSKLIDNKIDHIYKIKEGEHNWQYWNISIFEHLNFFNNFFKNQ